MHVTKKLLVSLFLLTFTISNGFILISNATHNFTDIFKASTHTITEYNSSVEENKIFGIQDTLTSDKNFILTEAELQVYALANSKYKINNNKFELIEGSVFLKSSNLNISLGNNDINYSLNNNFEAILDSEDGIIITSGEPAFGNKILELNTQISLVKTNQLEDFDRNKLKVETRYLNLTKFIQDLGINSEFFTDFTSPEITSISPRDNFTTVEPLVRLFGYTEADTKIIIQGSDLVADNQGYFTKQINLSLGINQIEISLKDKYGNQNIIKLTYHRNKDLSIPLSFPASYPVSYSN